MRDPFRWLLAALSVSLAASLFWGVQLRRQLAHERLGAASDHQLLSEQENRLRAAERARNAAEAVLQGGTGSGIRRMFPAGGPLPSADAINKFNAAMDGDPVWAPFFRKLERRRILSRYNILLSALPVPQGKRAALEDLLVERAIASRRVVHEQRVAGRKFDSPEAIAAVAGATDGLDAKINDLVGADIAGKLREWNTAIYSYGNAPDGPVAQDAVTLSDAGFEVTSDQLVKLALIRYEVYVLNPGPRPASAAEAVDPATGLTAQETRLLEREAEVLSKDEVAVLRNWSIEEHRARRAADAIRSTFHMEGERGSQ
jgi:hypothetical protein